MIVACRLQSCFCADCRRLTASSVVLVEVGDVIIKLKSVDTLLKFPLFKDKQLLQTTLFYSKICFKWYSCVLVNAKHSEKALENILFVARSELKPFLQVTNQSEAFKQHLLQQVYSLFNPTVTQPSVLLFLFPAESEETCDCFAQNLQKIVSRAFKDRKLISFDSKDLKQEVDGEVIKRILSEKFGNLKNNHVAILRNLEQLPPDAVMFLGYYLGNENIVHKRTLIILTMKTDLPYDMLPKENVKNEVEKTLEGLWRGKVRDADITAILARITKAIVPIKLESTDVIANVCPEKDEL